MNLEPRVTMETIIDRVLHGDASPQETERLTAWRNESNDNDRRYRQIETLVVGARGLRSVDAAPPAPTASEIQARGRAAIGPETVYRQPSTLGRWAPWAVAAAAVLALAVNIGRGPQPNEWAPAEIVTGQSEMTTATLADGSVVRLAPESRLRIDGGQERHVTLEGRAFFAVAHMPNSPFIVDAPGGTINVLGTRFELAADGEGLRVAVIEGRVALEALMNSVVVGAGEETAVLDGEARTPTRRADLVSTPAWVGRFLVFHATPLREVATQIEQSYGVRIAVADSALAGATLTATFIDRPLDEVLDVACEVLDARCVVNGNVVSVRR